jgi:hypothetical protein
MMDTLGFGCVFPTAGRIGDFHPLERVPAEHTQKAASTASFAINTITHFPMRVKKFYEYFCRNMQKNERLLQKTRSGIEFRLSKNMRNFGGCEFPGTYCSIKGVPPSMKLLLKMESKLFTAIYVKRAYRQSVHARMPASRNRTINHILIY